MIFGRNMLFEWFVFLCRPNQMYSRISLSVVIVIVFVVVVCLSFRQSYILYVPNIPFIYMLLFHGIHRDYITDRFRHVIFFKKYIPSKTPTTNENYLYILSPVKGEKRIQPKNEPTVVRPVIIVVRTAVLGIYIHRWHN
jgi:hypothetical protein